MTSREIKYIFIISNKLNNINIIYDLKVVFSYILEILRFDNIDEISVFLVNGFFNDVIEIELLKKNI